MEQNEEWEWGAEDFLHPWDDDCYSQEEEWEEVGWQEDLLTRVDKFNSLR